MLAKTPEAAIPTLVIAVDATIVIQMDVAVAVVPPIIHRTLSTKAKQWATFTSLVEPTPLHHSSAQPTAVIGCKLDEIALTAMENATSATLPMTA